MSKNILFKINKKYSDFLGIINNETREIKINDSKKINVIWLEECLVDNYVSIDQIKNNIFNSKLNQEDILLYTKKTSNKFANFKRVIDIDLLKKI